VSAAPENDVVSGWNQSLVRIHDRTDGGIALISRELSLEA